MEGKKRAVFTITKEGFNKNKCQVKGWIKEYEGITIGLYKKEKKWEIIEAKSGFFLTHGGFTLIETEKIILTCLDKLKEVLEVCNNVEKC